MASSGASAEESAIDILSKTTEYKGVNLIAMQLPEIIESLQTWETRPDDVYLVTYPKSGTHWIYEIVSLIMNDVQVEKIDRTHMVFALDLALSHKVDGLATVTPGCEAMTKWESPRVMSSHILEEFAPDQIKNKAKVIYFSRNPKDVSVSYFKFAGPALPAEMEGWKGFMPYFLSDQMFGGSWFRHVKGWFARKDEPNILLCKYEDFHKDLRGNIKRVADFLERPLSEEKLDKIVELTEMKGMQKTYQQIEDKMGDTGKSITRLFGQLPYLRKGNIKRVADFLERPLSEEKLDKIVELTEMKGMQKTYQQIEDKMGDTGKSITRLFGQLPYLRKGKVGSWKDNFTVAENEYFDKVYNAHMEGSGIEFEFEL